MENSSQTPNKKPNKQAKSARKVSHNAKNVKIKIVKINPTRRKVLRRSMSYDTLPKMKNKIVICQPLPGPRRLTVSRFQAENRNQNLILVCLALISFSSMLAMAIIAPFFPKEAAKKGMRESVNGLVFSVYAMVFMIFSPIMGLLIPKIGTKLTLTLGVFIAGVSNILFGVLDKIDDLNMFTTFCFVVRIFEAIGGTAFSTSTYTILMDEFSDNIGTAFSIIETSVGLGLSLGPAIGGFLYSIGGYGLPFFILGGFMLLTIPLCILLIRDSKNCKIVKSPLASYIKILSIRKVMVNGLVIIVGAQLISFLDPTMEPHLRGIGLSPNYVSLVFLIMSATYTVSSPAIGWLSDFTNKFKLMSIGLLMLAIEFFLLGPNSLLPFDTSFAQSSIVMGFIGISYSIAFIPTFETLLDLALQNGFPDDISTYSLVSGVWSSFCSFGEILGPVFGGFLTEALDFKKASSIMGLCALIMAIVCSASCASYVSGSSPTHVADPKKTTNHNQVNGTKHRKLSSKPNHARRPDKYSNSETLPLLA